MKNIYIYKNNRNLGPFSQTDIKAGLQNGEYLPEDHGWIEGQKSDWVTLAELVGRSTAPGEIGTISSSDPDSAKWLLRVSWIIIALLFIVALIPAIGILTWFIGAPALLATLVLGILAATRGKKLQGILIITTSVVIGPVYLFLIPLLTTALFGAAVAENENLQNFVKDKIQEQLEPHIDQITEIEIPVPKEVEEILKEEPKQE